MLQTIPVPAVDLSWYSDFTTRRRLDALRRTAARLAERRMLHLSPAADGIASSHLLQWLVPLTRALEIECEWRALSVQHAVAQDGGVDRSRPGRYADDIEPGWDVVVVHDHDHSLIAETARECSKTWLWHPGPTCGPLLAGRYGLLDRQASGYDGLVTDLHPPSSPSMPVPVWTIPHGVDPLAEASRPLDRVVIESLCESMGVDPARPLILHSGQHCSIAGVQQAIDAYWALKDRMPRLQMVVLASPWAATYEHTGFDYLLAHTAEDPDLHVLSALNPAEANALRSTATLVVQTHRGPDPGIDLVESLWKACPAVVRTTQAFAERSSAARMTIGAMGRSELAMFMHLLLDNPRGARRVGRSGQRLVRDRLLAPSLLASWLETVDAVLTRAPSAPLVGTTL